VAAEFAFVRIRTVQVDQLVREGRSSSGLVEEANPRLDAYLSVCQLGITFSSLGCLSSCEMNEGTSGGDGSGRG
jgi:CBS domain containing-hemolysin-like protein